MEIVWILAGVLALIALPIVVYLFSVRPKLEEKARWVLITGIIMSGTVIAPIIAMPALVYLVIWQVVLTVMLIVNAVVWIVGIVRRRVCYIPGALTTGLSVIVSSLLLGNWLAVIASMFYMVMLLRLWVERREK